MAQQFLLTNSTTLKMQFNWSTKALNEAMNYYIECKNFKKLAGISYQKNKISDTKIRNVNK